MSKTSRDHYLIKNTTIFAIGNMSTKLIHFFLVPFYTYLLSREEYGTVDLVISVCSMIIPLMMCNICEAVRRFLLDKDSNVNNVKAVEFIWIIIGFCVACLAFLVFSLIPQFKEFAIEISAYSFFNSLLLTGLDFLRGREKLGLYVTCSSISSLLTACLSILFLRYLHLGIHGYLLAYIISYGTVAALSFALGGQFRDWNKLSFDKTLFRDMSLFSIMLVPNSLMWWITNSSDRFMVTYMISASANGLYTVSYKLPSMISTLSTILMQAWQFSAIKESDSKDKVEYNNRMYGLYCAATSVIVAGLLLILRPFMMVYVSSEFTAAWKYSPFLLLGFMFQTLGTFVGTSYYVQKDVKGNLLSSGVGAGTNIMLNICLIPIIGVNGAAIATCISYFVVLAYRVFNTRKYIPINAFSFKYTKIYIVLLAMVGVVYIDGLVGYAALIGLFLLVLYFTFEYYSAPLQAIIMKLKVKK